MVTVAEIGVLFWSAMIRITIMEVMKKSDVISTLRPDDVGTVTHSL